MKYINMEKKKVSNWIIKEWKKYFIEYFIFQATEKKGTRKKRIIDVEKEITLIEMENEI